MPQRIKPFLVYSAFEGGERGTYGQWKQIAESFTGDNMTVYRDGTIGVRTGLLNISPSGLSNGKLHAFGTTVVPNADCWFIQGAHVYTFSSAGNNLQVAAATLATTPSGPCPYIEVGNVIYFCSPTDKVYKLQPASIGVPVLTPLTGSPGATCISKYGDFTVLGGVNGDPPNRLRFSNYYPTVNPEAWDQDVFVDIGDGRAVNGLWEQRTHLTVGKDNGVYIFTGAPDFTGVQRRLTTTKNGPISAFASVVDTKGLLHFRGLGMNSPSVFNGSTTKQLFNLENGMGGGDVPAIPPAIGATRLTGRDDGVFYTGATKGLLNLNGVWTSHTFAPTLTGYLSVQGTDDSVFMTDGGGTSAPPKFYQWRPMQQSPGIEGQSGQKAGDDSTTQISGTLTFPEWFHPWAFEEVVRSVVVDFEVWNTGGAVNNHFDLTLQATRRRSPGPKSAATRSFDEAGTTVGSTGASRLDRRVFAFGDQGPGNGFQMLFTNIRGCSIQRIELHYDNLLPLRGAN